MSNISKAEKNLKKKLSLDDYMLAEEQEYGQGSETDLQAAAIEKTCKSVAVKKDEQHLGSQKIKATYYLSEDDHSALTNVYIRRLQNKQKTDRSALISEAIRLLYKKEIV
jgi:hypothetical protein